MAKDLRELTQQKLEHLKKARLLETDANKQFKLNIDIEELEQQLKRANTQILTHLPRFEGELIGRDTVLEEMHQKLQAHQSVLLMNGMGGIGKTALAMEYANRHLHEYDYVVWIEQVGNDFANALMAAQLLHQNLGYQLLGKPQQDARNILNLLGQKEGKGLLLLDNMERDFEDYKDYLPRPRWHVLLTSREQLYEQEEHYITLDFLSPADARRLFYTHYRREENDVLLDTILQEVDYHTLTVELFAKTIQKREKSLTWLRDRLQERGLAIGTTAKDVKKQHRTATERLEKIFPYLKAMFDLSNLESEELLLLQRLCCLPPQPYPSDILAAFLQLEIDSGEYDEFTLTRNQLTTKGWLIRDESTEEETWKLHRVLQEVIWEKEEPELEDIRVIVQSVTQLLHFDKYSGNPVDKFPFTGFGNLLVKKVKQFEDEDISLFLDRLSCLYRYLGEYQYSMYLSKRALAIVENVANESQDLICTIKANLANSYFHLGQYKEATTTLETALNLVKNDIGNNHPKVAMYQSSLAEMYRNLGFYEEAKKMLENAIDSDIKNFGEKHPILVVRKINLASVYLDLNCYKEAATLLEDTLCFVENNFDKTHPYVATCKANLASVYVKLNRHSEAINLQKSSLNLVRNNLGSTHPHIAVGQSNLAEMYRNLGNYKEAKRLLQNSISLEINHFGEQHPTLAITYNNLALVFANMKHYQEAVETCSKVLAILQYNFSSHHPHFEIAKQNLLDFISDGAAAGDTYCKAQLAKMEEE